MAKNYLYNLLLTLANLLFPILSFPYVSRVLGPGGIGTAQFVFSFAQYFALIANFGIPVYGMKEIARYRDYKEGRSKVFSELMVIYMLTSVCLSAFYLGAINLFPYFSADKQMFNAALLLILIGFSYVEWAYTGMEEFKSIALRSVLFKVIGLLLMFVFIKSKADYPRYLYLMMFSFLGNNILSLFLLRGKLKLTFSNLNLKQHVVPLLFIFGTTIAASMYADSDTVLLGFLSDKKTVGLYTAAVKLSKISIPIVTSMGVILMPKIAKFFAEQNMAAAQYTLDQTFRFLVFCGIPIAFGLSFLAPEFIAVFSGVQFTAATQSMQILSVLPFIIGFAHMLLFLILVPAGRNREMFVSVLGGLITSLILNFVLVPPLKQVGSAIANIASEVVVMALYFYFIKKHFTFQFRWILILNAIISALIFVPIVSLLRRTDIALLYRLPLTVALCAIAYGMIQLIVFKNDFLQVVGDMIKSKLNKTAV